MLMRDGKFLIIGMYIIPCHNHITIESYSNDKYVWPLLSLDLFVVFPLNYAGSNDSYLYATNNNIAGETSLRLITCRVPPLQGATIIVDSNTDSYHVIRRLERAYGKDD